MVVVKDNLPASKAYYDSSFQRIFVHHLRSIPNRTRDMCMDILMPKQQINQAITRHGVRFRQCLYTPLVIHMEEQFIHVPLFRVLLR